MNQKIFNSKYFESYYKVISGKNLELDFCKYFWFYVYFKRKYNCKTIIKEKKQMKCRKLNINTEILKTSSQIKYRKTVPFCLYKMPIVTSLQARTILHAKDEMKTVLSE